MPKAIQNIVEEAGLSGREAKVYLKLLNLGETTSGELIKETKMYKADVYEVVKKLVEKGLISYIKRNAKLFYKPADPKKLLNIIEDKKAELERKKADISSILKELEEKYKSQKIKREVSVLEGIEGLKTILIDAAKEKKPIYLLGASMRFFEIMAHRLPQWEKQRDKSKIELIGIWVDNPEVRRWNKDRTKIKARYIPEEQLSQLATWGRCGDFLAIMVMEESPLIIKIKSREIAEAFAKQFEMMWKMAKE